VESSLTLGKQMEN